MAYEKRNWGLGTTPLSADNLNAMDDGIYQNSKNIEQHSDKMTTIEATLKTAHNNSVRNSKDIENLLSIKVAGFTLTADITAVQLQTALKAYPFKIFSKTPTTSDVGSVGQLGGILTYSAASKSYSVDLFLCCSIDSANSAYYWALVNSNNISDAQISAAISEYLEKNPIEGLSQIEPPTIVKSVDEMTDTSKHYVLNGDIYSYMSGKSGLTPDFTNLADATLTTDATITTTSNGWLEDVRINSSNAIATADGNDITNYITIGNKSVVRIKNMDINGGYGRIYFYSNGAYLFGLSVGDATLKYFTEINDEYAEITSAKLLECLKANKGSSATFDKIRFGGTLTGTKEDVIITLDEEITYTDSVGYEWTNTGLQYTATLYTDLIGIVDENNVIRLSSNNLPSGTYTLKYGDESFDTIGTITID